MQTASTTVHSEEETVERTSNDKINCRAQLNKCFQILLRKLWCGQFSSLHPKAFKMSLGLVHPSFAGSRQVNLAASTLYVEHSSSIALYWLFICSKIVRSSLLCYWITSMSISLVTTPLQHLRLLSLVRSRVS